MKLLEQGLFSHLIPIADTSLIKGASKIVRQSTELSDAPDKKLFNYHNPIEAARKPLGLLIRFSDSQCAQNRCMPSSAGTKEFFLSQWDTHEFGY